MRKLIVALVIITLLVSGVFLFKKVTTKPVSGTILRYETFRGCEVPIIANGKGGSYRWVADVPWNKFSIEEKFDMARVNGGHLSTEDLAEIWFKFGEWRKAGEFYGIQIYKKE